MKFSTDWLEAPEETEILSWMRKWNACQLLLSASPLPAFWELLASTSICDMAFLIDVPGCNTGHHTGFAICIPGPLAISFSSIWKKEHDWTAVRVPNIMMEVLEKEEAVDATVTMN